VKLPRLSGGVVRSSIGGAPAVACTRTAIYPSQYIPGQCGVACGKLGSCPTGCTCSCESYANFPDLDTELSAHPTATLLSIGCTCLPKPNIWGF
jgi:hypothetical protein